MYFAKAASSYKIESYNIFDTSILIWQYDV